MNKRLVTMYARTRNEMFESLRSVSRMMEDIPQDLSTAEANQLRSLRNQLMQAAQSCDFALGLNSYDSALD